MFREDGGKEKARETSREVQACITPKGIVYFEMGGEDLATPVGLVLRNKAGSETCRLNAGEVKEMRRLGVSVSRSGDIVMREVTVRPGTLHADAPKAVWIERLRNQFGLDFAPGAKVD